MQIRPKVSVVIPIYNVENYLEDCINSIRSQYFDNLEIILINDGSLDKSQDICEAYERIDNRIKLINKKNGGVSSARNLGLNIASGEFVCFIDADDKILPNYFDVFYNVITRNECDVVVAGYKFSDSENKVITSFKKNIVLPGKELILTNHNVHTSNDLCFPWRYFYRLSLIRKHNIRFNEDISIGEDTIFNMEIILNSERVISIDNIVYEYRIDNPNSTMRTKYKPNLEKSLVLQYEKKNKLSDQFNLNKNDYYIRDMSIYYINNILSLLISNIKSSDSNNKKQDIRRVINYEMIRRSFEKIGVKYNAYSIKEYISYIVMKFKIYPVINYIVKLK